MADTEDWASDANEVVQISLIQPGATEPQAVATFHPRFTYPIFGEEEQVFGYQDLSVHLRFAAHDLLPNLEVTWDQKFKPVGDICALDIEGTLKDWLPEAAFSKTSGYLGEIQSSEGGVDFKPSGELLSSYEIRGRNFEIWRGKLNDPALRLIFERMQIFITFFIEGGSYINLQDPQWSLDRWTVYFLYEKLKKPPTPTASVYSFVGYCTSYRYYFYDHSRLLTPPTTPPKPYPKQAIHDFTLPLKSPVTLPCRERISQFLILPPYQNQGHGSRFYGALVDAFLADPLIKEITVEDPNEAFDDLRDYCDTKRLRENGTFAEIKINTDVDVPRKGKLPTSQILDKDLLEKLRLRNKIAPRQFERVVEMELLSRIPPKSRRVVRARNARAKLTPTEKEYELWRLMTKQRLYKFNRDKLAQLDGDEKIDKLVEVCQGVEADYVRLLRNLARGNGAEDAVAGSVENGNGVPEGKGKKRMVEDASEGEGTAKSNKKARVEDDSE